MTKRFNYALLISVFALPAAALADNAGIDDLGKLSLESLGNIVTSVSRKPEDSFRAAAAIYVITNDDIKASGATHVAEVLRGVPGMDVARVDASNWAISSRGFNGLFANKLLVQIDGRTIYTPLFAGVYWDIQNLPLEDVDRIEVIRGPGATQWGANAVNGIINIITKSSAATQGVYVSTLAGNQDRSITDVRYGGKLGDNAYYRTYGEFTDRAATPTPGNGPSGHNAWYDGKAGFRSDWNVSSTRKITLQGDVYNADINLDLYLPSFSAPSGTDIQHDQIHSHGFNTLGRWEEKHSDSMQSTFQAYIDYQSPNYSSLQQEIYTFDLDYQTNWKASDRNEVMWGAGSRFININQTGSTQIVVAHNISTETIVNAFLQDTYAVVPNEVYVTLGSKLEHNSFSGYEIEPSARIAWYPDNKQTLWAAVSRAVKTPSIAEESWNLNVQTLAPEVIAQQQFNRNLVSEDLIAYELGYRVKPVHKVCLDSTVFINDYRKLTTFEPLALVDAGGGNFYAPFQINNLGSGHAFGFEESASWDVTSHWNLLANYSYINLLLNRGFSQDPTFSGQSGDVPHNQFMIRSQLYLPHDVRLINTGYYVSRLPNQSVDSYFRFDTQVIWKATEGIELSLDGQNILDNRHPEFGAPLNGAQNEIPRAVYGRITFRY